MAEAATTEQMLHEVGLFAGLKKRHLRRLLKFARETEHQAGHVVADEGLGALAFHLILSGEASVRVGTNEVGRLRSGDYFGEISMIDGKARSASVVAVQPLRTIAINRQAFLDLLDSEPGFARAVLEGLCARVRTAEARPTS